MVLVVNPNTCLDVTTWVARLVPGAVMRAPRTVTTAGGKGVNVARALRLLGERPRLVALASTRDDRLQRLLAEEGCDLVAVPQRDVPRIAQIILEDDGRATVINGRGPDADDWSPEGFLDAVRSHVAGRRVLTCSGSLPPGAPDDFYGQVVDIAHGAGLRAVVDAGPAVLAAALRHGPDVVSPNLAEAEALLRGRADETSDEAGDIEGRALEASREIHASGAGAAVVTGGRHGAALTTARGSWWFPAHTVALANPIGAGDAFLGGMTQALTHGGGMLAAVRHGIDVAGAACEHEQPGAFAPERLGELTALDLTPEAR